jgi:hypothetical protein
VAGDRWYASTVAQGGSMAEQSKGSAEMSPERVIGLLTDVRNRLSTVAWALHGMHHESEPPGPDDLAAVEQLVSDTIEGPLNDACAALGPLLGMSAEDAGLTRH